MLKILGKSRHDFGVFLSHSLGKEHHHMGVPIMKEANETMAEDLVEPHKCTTHLLPFYPSNPLFVSRPYKKRGHSINPK
jgi:hypothetical protein